MTLALIAQRWTMLLAEVCDIGNHMPKKLSVLCRVEPGCLGPDGREHIEAFCTLAQQAMKHFAVDLVTWTLVPRYDKTMPEMEYTVDHKNLSRSQVSYTSIH